MFDHKISRELVLVTGASGKQASELIPHLYGKRPLRLVVNSDASKERLEKQYPNAETVKADLTDSDACSALLKGVTACFLVTPAFTQRENSMPFNIIDAATEQRSSGGPFKHLVYSTVISPILRKLLNHDSKRYAEEYLIESGLPYTIVQPTHLMETFPIAKVLNEDKPVYPASWNPETKFSFCTTKDLGEAVARIIEKREKHLWATYQFVSTKEPMDYNEVVEIVSEKIGKKIEIKQRPLEEAVEAMAPLLGNGSSTAKEGLARMFLYYNERGLVGNCNVLEWILERPTIGYSDWARIKVKEVKEQMAQDQ